jgi:undecaprenyl-diphosphatase
MTFIQAIVLGLVQGLTEFLPVSSSGHLIFFPYLFGWADQGVLFDIVLHMGTLCAVIVFYRTKLLSLIRAFFSCGETQKTERRLAWLLGLSILPAGIVGFVLETNTRSATVVGVSLIFWAIVLYAADRYGKHKQRTGIQKEITSVSTKDIVFMSIAQAVALIPGTSRSGITMSTGLFRGLSKTAAADISFLMSVPILVVAGSVKILEAISSGVEHISFLLLFVGFFASFVSGVFAISLLLKVIKKFDFTPFVVYRIVVGVLILWLL